MLRCAQMLLANTLKRLYVPKPYLLKDVIQLFLDIPNAPFGIHALCTQGRASMLKEPGDWYGVNSIAQVITDHFGLC